MNDTILQYLLQYQDLDYKAFQCALMPTVPADRVLGVRTPVLRKLAAQLKGEECFLRELPHRYYEENNLHGFILCGITDFDRCVREIERFLSYVDNWATCDSLRPKCFAKNKEKLLPYIRRWMASGHTYTVRFGIQMLMVHFLEGDFSPEYLRWVALVRSEEYYVKMMIAWYFATALAKQWNESVVYLEKGELPRWTHNKTIQKAMESYRITQQQKQYLKTLKR